MKLISLIYHELLRPASGEAPTGSGLDPDGSSTYSIPVHRFEEHLELIKKHGIPVRLVDDKSMNDGGGAAALITFDDGGRSAFDLAKPLLDRFGMKAHFFIPTDLLDTPGFMTSEQVRTLHQEGHVIGTHGASHRYFSRLSEEELKDELVRSRERIESIVDAPCNALAIPGGDVRKWMSRLFEETGYSIVFGSVPKMATVRDIGKCSIGRICPRSYETLDNFAQTITPPYRWFRWHYRRYIVLLFAKKILGLNRFREVSRRLLARKAS